MGETREGFEYGFGLWPFAIVIVVGFFISSTAPAVLRSLLAGLTFPGSRAVLLVLMLALQAVGAVLALGGFFGALYRTLQDSR